MGLGIGCGRVRAKKQDSATDGGLDTFQVEVALSAPRQVIENFGASGCWSADPIGSTWSEAKKNQLADLLFSQEKGIGLSLWRFNIGAGSKNTDHASAWHPWRAVECFKESPTAPYDWSRHAGQQWFLRAARQRGTEQLLAFVNSPPVWLTRNGHAYSTKGDPASTNLKQGAEDAFASFLADVMAHFQQLGLPFDGLSPINEPNWAWEGGQEGCRYSNDDAKRVLRATSRALRARGLSTKLHGLDGGDLRLMLDDADYRDYQRLEKPGLACPLGHSPTHSRQWIKALLGDPELRALLSNSLSCHSYWTTNGHHELQNLRLAVRRNLDRYAPGATLWQSEFCFMEHKRDLGMDTALRLAEVIHYDLTAAQVSAWNWWLALSDADYKDGLIYIDPKTEAIQTSKLLWVLGNYSRFIRPGSHRVQVRTNALPDELLASAYVDRQRGRVIVVLTNRQERALSVQLAFDQQVGSLTPYTTSATQELTPGPALVGGHLSVPPRSVVTLVGTATTTSTPLTSVIPRSPLLRQRPGSLLYDVRCGRTEHTETPACNSRWDMPFGPDPGTGFLWGYSSYGPTGTRTDLDGAYSSVRWEDGDTAGEGLTYRFTIPETKPCQVELALLDPWHAKSRRLDITLNGKKVAAEVIPGATPLINTYSGIVPEHGEIVVRITRSQASIAASDDPLLSGVKITASSD